MCVGSQQCMQIEHEQIMNECTYGFEDSHTHTIECVDFSGFSTLSVPQDMSCVVLLLLSYFWSVPV
jgi:hypothetical protein